MKSVILAALCLAAPIFAQSKQEIGLTLGRLGGSDRGPVSLDSGTAFQANYGIRLAGGEKAALFGEVHFLASPQRLVTAASRNATRDVASLYVTPGIRVKFWPTARVQPYVAAGGGLAVYEHSTLNLAGSTNAAPRTANTGAFTYGGGVDVPVLKWFGLRFEVRDFVTGSPVYNVPVNGRQHNVVTGGGVTLRF